MRVRKFLQKGMLIHEYTEKDGMLLREHIVDRVRDNKAWTDTNLVFMREINKETKCPIPYNYDPKAYFKLTRTPDFLGIGGNKNVPVSKWPKDFSPKVKLYKSKRQNKARQKHELKRIVVSVSDRSYRFLKYYIFFIKWAAAKFGLTQEDLELGFYFYDENIPFTKQQFDEVCRLTDPQMKVTKKWRYWINDGLIRPVYTLHGTQPKIKQYKLSRQFIVKIDKLYQRIALETQHNTVLRTESTTPVAMQKLLDQMTLEREEIRKGFKVADKILLEKNEEE